MGVSGLPPDHDLYARAALSSYGRDPDAPLRLLSLSENATYLVDDADPIVLRVHRAGYHSLQAIRSELAWMAALREQTDVVTPQLIPAQNGDEVVTAVINDHPLNVDAVTFVSGCTAEERPEAVGFDQSPAHHRCDARPCPRLGSAGLLHAVLVGCRDHDRTRRALGELAARAWPDQDG